MPSPELTPSDPAPGATQTRFFPAACVALLGGVVILAARAFGAVPLFVVGVGLVVLGGLAPAWLLAAARRTRLSRRFSVHRTIEDEPLEAIIEIRRGWLGLPGAELYDPLAQTSISVADALSMLTGRRRVQFRVIARIPTRGRHRFPPPSLTLGDAMGLGQVWRAGWGAEDEVLVLPRTEQVHWLRRDHRKSTSGQAYRSAHEPLGAGEVDGLRQYMPGTPASRIHWPALARGAGLLERRLVSEPQTMPLIVLDPRRATGGDPELLNAAVRATASLALELARSGGVHVLLPGDRDPTLITADLGGWSPVHTRLALIEEEHDMRRGPSLRRDSARGPVILVATRLDARSRLGTLAGHATQLVLVVPSHLGARLELPASFQVSGCTGFVLRSHTRHLRRAVAA
jgi:uncharacterized protein (DUF58 family)